MSLLDRLAPRRPDVEPAPIDPASVEPATFATKALKKLLTSVESTGSRVLLDLGPVVGSNVSFFGERFGCKIFVEDIFADLDRHIRAGARADLPRFLRGRFPQLAGAVDGVLCWDLLDHLDRPAALALAEELTRVLRPHGVLLGLFRTAQRREPGYTKFIVVDEGTLRPRSYPSALDRQGTLHNGDIIRLFPGLRVSDSFLLQNNLREFLFRKPV